MGKQSRIAWTLLLGAVVAIGPLAAAVGYGGPPSRVAIHAGVQHAHYSRLGWRHRHLPSTYPDFAWGPPWGSFSVVVAPPHVPVPFCAPALTYPWFRYAYPGVRYGTFDPYRIYYNQNTGRTEYFLPPIYMPGELAYGPRALERFLGWPTGTTVPAPLRAASGSTKLSAPTDAASIRARMRKSNKASRARAQHFVQFGDALFQQQRYHEAVQRYRSAIEAAPDVADAYYHEGYALLATNRFTLAAKAFRIALQLDPHVGARLRLRDLYEHNLIAIDAHLENLAAQALAHPTDPDLLMMVGLFLRDEGQPKRALKFLRKARQLAGAAGDYLQPLIDEATPAPPAEEVLAGVDT